MPECGSTDGPWEVAAAGLPSPVLVGLVGAAVRLAGEVRLDVGARLLLVHRPRRLVVHPLPDPDVAPRRRSAHRERQQPLLALRIISGKIRHALCQLQAPKPRRR
jgi:hypothetical protein